MSGAPFGFGRLWPVVPVAPDDEATPVGLAPGQMPVDPRRDGSVQPTAAGQAVSRAIGARLAQAGEGVGSAVNAFTRPPEGPASTALPFSFAPAAPQQDAWETPAGPAPGQPPVDPRRDGMIQPNTLGRAMQHAVGAKAAGAAKGLLDIGALPGDVSAGRTDPLSDEGIRRAFDLAGTLATGGMPMAEAGAAGIFGGRLSRGANKEALAEAQDLAAQGIGRKDIWTDTGWFQGADKQWRYEIPDGPSAYTGDGKRLGQALDHPELYEAYPSLKGAPFLAKDLPGAHGGYDVMRGRIEVNNTLPAARQHNSTLHETQHRLQGVEGFETGSNLSQKSLDDYDGFLAQREAAGHKISDADWTQEAFEDWRFKQYWDHPGEVEARNVERRRLFDDAERRSVPPWESADTTWPQPAPGDAYVQHPRLAAVDEANPIGGSVAAGLAGGVGLAGAAALSPSDAQAAPASPSPATVPFGPVPTAWTSGNLSDRIVGAESGGNATAKNPRSSATGAGQFIDGTWLDMVRRYRPDLAGLPRDQVLALRNDAGLSREMVGHYADENGAKLRSAGLPDTDGTRYLAHFAGPAGARAVLSADPSTPAAQVLQPGQVAANPFVRNMTAGQLADWAARKVGSDAPTMRIPGGSNAPGGFGLSGPTQGRAPFSMMPAGGAAMTMPADSASEGPGIASLLRVLMEEPAAAPQAQAAPAPAPASAPFGFAPLAAMAPPAPRPVPFDYEKFVSLLRPRRPTR